MTTNCYALKIWLAVAAALTPLVAFCGWPDTNTASPSSPREWHAVATHSAPSKGTQSGTAPLPLGNRGWLGLVISGSPEGAVVERVDVGGLAWQAGVRNGDVIVAINGKLLIGLLVPKIAQLLREPAGSEIELTLRRPGQRNLLKTKPRRGMPPLARDDGLLNNLPNESLELSCRGIDALGTEQRFGYLPYARCSCSAAVAQVNCWAIWHSPETD